MAHVACETAYSEICGDLARETVCDRHETHGYVRLPLSFFRNEEKLAVHVYFMGQDSDEPSLVAAPGLLRSEWQFDEIARHGYRWLYVQRDELDKLHKELEKHLDTIVADESLPSVERFTVLQTVVANEVERTLRASNCDRFVSLSERMGSQIANLVSEKQSAPPQLFELARHDTTTFVHATNVAAYAVMLADELGIVDADEREQLAVGAMLHDIGKRGIPVEVLTKPGRLNEEERRQIERHPQLGYEELVDHPGLGYAQLMMVYQHHEWLDGSGYPVEITAEEIHPWAKLLAVVDSFDAITAKRPYQAGLAESEALNLMAERADTQFDRELLRCWVSLFHRA